MYGIVKCKELNRFSQLGLWNSFPAQHTVVSRFCTSGSCHRVRREDGSDEAASQPEQGCTSASGQRGVGRVLPPNCNLPAVFPEESQLMKTWLKARIISIHTAEEEFTEVACAFSLCAALHKQESHPIFPSGPHGTTEPHLFLWHWQYGSKRKIPELPGTPDCWVPESENILPAVSVRKTEPTQVPSSFLEGWLPQE